MTGPGARTADDVHRSPEVVLALLDRLDAAAATLAADLAGGVRFLGCGSSHLGGGLAAGLLSRAGVPAEAVVGAEGALGGERPRPGQPAVAVSRSGTTTETLLAVRAHREGGGGPVTALVCDAASPLAALADVVVALPEAGEDVVAQTRSVAAFLAFSLLLAGHAAGSSPAAALRGRLESLLEERPARAERAAGAAESAGERLLVLGGGARWWLARETALKCAEMARVPARAERITEHPHGPVEAVDGGTTVLAFPTPALAAVEEPALRQVAGLARDVVRFGPPAGSPSPGGPAELLADLHDGHLFALALSRARGVDADSPQHIAAAITLDLP